MRIHLLLHTSSSYSPYCVLLPVFILVHFCDLVLFVLYSTHLCPPSDLINFQYTNVSHCDRIGVTIHRGAFFMTTGEKIKYFRNMRGISQETLGQLSGINSATIKKYEYGIRNPKPDQLLKIANALGISINIFMDFDIETVSDVLSLLFKLDDQIDMKFEADKDDEGNFKPATVKLSFKNNLINKKLCTYMKALEILENMLNAKDEYSEEEYADSLQHINENIEEIKQHLLDDNMVVKKDTDRLTVKIFPN